MTTIKFFLDLSINCTTELSFDFKLNQLYDPKFSILRTNKQQVAKPYCRIIKVTKDETLDIILKWKIDGDLTKRVKHYMENVSYGQTILTKEIK